MNCQLVLIFACHIQGSIGIKHFQITRTHCYYIIICKQNTEIVQKCWTHLHHRCCFLLHTERSFVWEQYRHRRWPCQYRQLYCFKIGCANNGISCPPQLSFSCQSKGRHFKTLSSLSALHPCLSTSQTCDIFFITACFSISFRFLLPS